MVSRSLPTYRRPHGPTYRQLKAIDLVVAGLTDAAVADQIGVSRNTVSKWRNYDAVFRSALNQRRAELLSGGADAVRAVLPLALEAVREQLGIGPRRDRLGLDFLTRTGLIGPRGGTAFPANPLDVGPTTVEGVLDAEVRRFRAIAATGTAGDDPGPDLDAPITDEERETAYLRLQALSARTDEDLEDPPAPENGPEDGPRP